MELGQMNAGPQRTPYDEVPYPGYTHPQTHPNRLATIGRLFGMRPAPVDACRVLELGCGDGSNLVPMAFNLPDSRFVGIDLAGSAIENGRGVIRELGLKNIEVRQEDILRFAPGSEKFDYIIAHGIYSWVPPEVKDALLRVCRGNLAAQGIAFVSYNAYPGGHLRMMLREMMFIHLRQFADPRERLQQAMALIRFLADARETPEPYVHFLREELKEMAKRREQHLYHDELAEFYEPVYFQQFWEHARRHRLEYLGEAHFMEMQDHLFTEPTRAALRQLAHNRVAREQYLDFLKCRRFRHTLLCHEGTKLRPEPDPEIIREFYLASLARLEAREAKLADDSIAKFQGKKQATVETNFPLAKAALATLGDQWPQAMKFSELVERASARLGRRAEVAEEATLCKILLETYGTGLLELHAHRVGYCAAASEFPAASPLVRWQLGKGNTATNAWHNQVEVMDDIGRHLLSLLDGTRDRAMLLKETRAWLEKSAKPAETDNLETELEENLLKVARLGLLVK